MAAPRKIKPFSMVTSSNGNVISHLCEEFTGDRWIPRTKASDLLPNKRVSKQWWCWLFETPSCPLWRQCNEQVPLGTHQITVDNSIDDDYSYCTIRPTSQHIVTYRLIFTRRDWISPEYLVQYHYCDHQRLDIDFVKLGCSWLPIW